MLALAEQLVKLDEALHPLLVGGGGRDASTSCPRSQQWHARHTRQIAAASLTATACTRLCDGSALRLDRSDLFRLAAAARLVLRSGEAAAATVADACRRSSPAEGPTFYEMLEVLQPAAGGGNERLCHGCEESGRHCHCICHDCRQAPSAAALAVHHHRRAAAHQPSEHINRRVREPHAPRFEGRAPCRASPLRWRCPALWEIRPLSGCGAGGTPLLQAAGRACH